MMAVALSCAMGTTGLPAVSKTVPFSIDKNVSIGGICGTLTEFSAKFDTLMFLMSIAVKCSARCNLFTKPC